MIMTQLNLRTKGRVKRATKNIDEDTIKES